MSSTFLLFTYRQVTKTKSEGKQGALPDVAVVCSGWAVVLSRVPRWRLAPQPWQSANPWLSGSRSGTLHGGCPLSESTPLLHASAIVTYSMQKGQVEKFVKKRDESKYVWCISIDHTTLLRTKLLIKNLKNTPEICHSVLQV